MPKPFFLGTLNAIPDECHAFVTQTEVGALYLIHNPTRQFASGGLFSEALTQFDGPVAEADGFVSLSFD